jgi:hypothetical protein
LLESDSYPILVSLTTELGLEKLAFYLCNSTSFLQIHAGWTTFEVRDEITHPKAETRIP